MSSDWYDPTPRKRRGRRPVPPPPLPFGQRKKADHRMYQVYKTNLAKYKAATSHADRAGYRHIIRSMEEVYDLIPEKVAQGE